MISDLTAENLIPEDIGMISTKLWRNEKVQR